VIALVIVLVDDLPVRIEDVFVAGSSDEPLRFVIHHELLEIADVIGKVLGVARSVHEEPAMPLAQPGLDQRIVRLVEPRYVPESWGAPYGAVGPIDPCVVGTLDDL
jgi:hypothetical protein